MGTSLYNLVKEKGCLVWVVIIIILISVSASAQQPTWGPTANAKIVKVFIANDSLPAIDTASLTVEDPQEFLEWVTDGFIFLGGNRRDGKEKKWKQKGTNKIFTIRQLYNQFVYEMNECWWDDEEAIKHTKEIKPIEVDISYYYKGNRRLSIVTGVDTVFATRFPTWLIADSLVIKLNR